MSLLYFGMMTEDEIIVARIELLTFDLNVLASGNDELIATELRSNIKTEAAIRAKLLLLKQRLATNERKNL